LTSGTSGTGNGTTAFSVAVNTGAERTSTLTIAGTAITITQRAAAAAPASTLAPPTPRSPSGGQDVELRPTLVVNNAVATGAIGTVTYRFEVSSDNTFPNDGSKTITQDGVAQGSATTSWPVPRDLSQGVVYFWRARATNGTITTAFSAVESFKAGGGLCNVVLAPTSVTVSGSGGTATITITTTGSCSWSAVSNDGFIVLTTPSSGSGSGSLSFSVAANTGAARNGSLTVAGQTVMVSQAAANQGGSVVAGFRLLDPGRLGSAPTTSCWLRSVTSQPTQCTLESTSYPTGTNGITGYSWVVSYTYPNEKAFTQIGTNPQFTFSDICGLTGSTDSGLDVELKVSLTVTDSTGTSVTVQSNAGSQPLITLRAYLCGI
jgi:hypothetical protein